MKHKLLTLILALAVVIGLVSSTGIIASAATPVEYGVAVAGMAFTSDNLVIDANDNVVGVIGGSAEYDPSTNTLTLTDFTYHDDEVDSVIVADSNLTIVINGNNSIISAYDAGTNHTLYAINVDGDLVIEGTGSLHVENTGTSNRGNNVAVYARSVYLASGNLVAVAGETTGTGESYGIFATAGFTMDSDAKLSSRGYTAAWASEDVNGALHINELPGSFTTDSHFLNAANLFVSAPDTDAYKVADKDRYLSIEVLPAVSVCLHDSFGIKIRSEKVVKGESIVSPTHPSLEDSVFVGWYTYDHENNAFGNVMFNFPTVVTDDVHIYAKFINIADLRAELEVMIGDVEDSVAELEATTAANLAEAVGQLVEKLATLESAYMAADATLKAELERQYTSLIDNVTNTLNNKIDDLQTQINTLDQELDVALNDISANAGKIANLVSDLDTLVDVVSDLSDSLDDYVIEFNDKLDALADLINDVNSGLAARVKVLEDDFLVLDNALTNAIRRIMDLENADRATLDEIAALAARLLIAEQEVEDLWTALGNYATKTELADEVASLNDAIDGVYDELDNAIDTLTGRVDVIDRELQSALEDIVALENVDAALIEKIEDHSARLTAVEQLAAALEVALGE